MDTVKIRDDGSIPTVSVVVMNDEILDCCTSFPETKEGNKKAEALFRKTVKAIRPSTTDSDMDMFLEDGHFTTLVFITHT